LIRLSCKGTESFWILRFLLDQAGLSVHRSRGTWPDTQTCEAARCWCFKCWMSHASLPSCFWLSVRVVRCCSHLARPCKVFHNLGGKTCGTLINQSHDAWSESEDTIGVGKCDQSRDIWPKSYLPTGVGHTIEVAHTTELWYTCIISMHNV
jgi:hypothetical protein